MPVNPCAMTDCRRAAWFLDPATLQLYCAAHAPERSIDTFPSLIREMLHDQAGAANFLKDPQQQAFVADLYAELDRRQGMTS